MISFMIEKHSELVTLDRIWVQVVKSLLIGSEDFEFGGFSFRIKAKYDLGTIALPSR